MAWTWSRSWSFSLIVLLLSEFRGRHSVQETHSDMSVPSSAI
jgi:hypothetical protein